MCTVTKVYEINVKSIGGVAKMKRFTLVRITGMSTLIFMPSLSPIQIKLFRTDRETFPLVSLKVRFVISVCVRPVANLD